MSYNYAIVTDSSNPFGKKVLFVDPPYNISSLVIPLLLEMEYEIYTIDTYKRLKAVLTKFPDTIVIINPENELNTDAWIRLIQSIEANQAFSQVIIGVVARAIRKTDKDRFVAECKLEAGFVQQVPDKDELTAQFNAIFGTHGAKGRRKYARANCADDNAIYATATIHGTKLRFSIQDISTVGISAKVNREYTPILPANTVLPDFTLILQGTELKIGAVIIMAKAEKEFLILVTLFRSGMSTNIKNMIREYVSQKLAQSLLSAIADEADDETDYLESPSKTKEESAQ